MSSIYKARWNYITSMFSKIERYATNEHFMVEIEECRISSLTITDKMVSSDEDTCLLMWAENDIELDHGLHTTVPEWKKWFADNVKIYHVDIIEWV